MLACHVLSPGLAQAAAHLAKMGGTASGARQAQRLRSICRAFIDECRSAEADGERGREAAAASSGRSTAATGTAAEGVRSRLHECAGFVAVLTLLLQPLEEWARCKRFVLVSSRFSLPVWQCMLRTRKSARVPHLNVVSPPSHAH